MKSASVLRASTRREYVVSLIRTLISCSGICCSFVGALYGPTKCFGVQPWGKVKEVAGVGLSVGGRIEFLGRSDRPRGDLLGRPARQCVQACEQLRASRESEGCGT